MADEDDYESDPEQAKLSLKMRRRQEASDDEEEDDGDARVRVNERVIDSMVSDYESDGQGAAAEYEEDDDDDEYDDLVEEEEVVEDEVKVEDNNNNNNKDVDRVYVGESGEQLEDNGNGGGEEGGGQGEKKENEPFAVPTAGAFYMHDDRFRDSAGGRNRRTLGGRKLWELRDDSKWGHDKYEEMSMHERPHNEGRRGGSRGRNRTRGRNRGEDHGFVRGNRPKSYNNNNQTSGPKSVRGRGPRRYQPSTQNSFESSAQSRQFAKPIEKTSHANSGRASAATSASESSQVPVRKNVASSLNYASPPFYPSGSSNKETNLTQKKDAQTGSVNRAPHNPVMAENYPARGKNVSGSLGMDKLYIDDSISKPVNNMQPQAEGRGPGPISFGNMAYQPVNRPNVQPSGQQFVARSASGSRASSPPKTSSPAHGVESLDVESSTESNDSKTALVGKGKGSIIPSSGMSSFSYGDQNFPGAPTFLPVMQFAGQHPGGLGVPAVGMAFPGYVGQPNGMGNSEMTWLPVLAGAAGALGAAGLGATYPYITMDGAYHARASGQPSSLAPPMNKDGNMNKSANEMMPSQKPELANDELRQRQNKARRYTEMKFDK
ncbi:protein MLN51 homolog [Bidens hawaiensis]|uniref:protein MLN51 homolog n=1 Tax=Bidens hawaiensis TaxID=980011 RepID=UPI00404B9B3A